MLQLERLIEFARNFAKFEQASNDVKSMLLYRSIFVSFGQISSKARAANIFSVC